MCHLRIHAQFPDAAVLGFQMKFHDIKILQKGTSPCIMKVMVPVFDQMNLKIFHMKVWQYWEESQENIKVCFINELYFMYIIGLTAKLRKNYSLNTNLGFPCT